MQIQNVSSGNTQFNGKFLHTESLDKLRKKLVKKPNNRSLRILENMIGEVERVKDGRKFVYNSNQNGSWISERIVEGNRNKDVTLFFSRLKNNHQYLFSELLRYYL